VGTVARTTTPETKSLGYSVYYTLVNFGGFIGPLLALPVRESLGIEYVLVMASLVSLLNFIGTLVFFKEPTGGTPPSEAPRTFGKVFADMVLVFGNVRFISFLVIFSGFWVMFWQIFYTLPFYVKDVLHFEKFEILETVDALGIILFSVPITAAMSKVRPILAMSLGFTVASGAWLLMAASPTVAATVAAMILFAMGEAMQAPRFYEYVSDLAPREQVGTFMGFAFLPVAIGALLAGRLSGYLVQHYIKDLQQPAGMWVLLSVLGFVTTGLMLAYDRLVAGRKTA
jgi:dipeptide/tripeptide permease